MITFKINLLQYKAAIVKMKNNSGKEVECVAIPIELNNLFKGEKGVYAEFVAFELKEQKNDSKDTHLVKQSLPKDVLKAMSDEDKTSLPIFGNLRVWSERGEQESTSSTTAITESDKLPWE
jgi:hypothetical protein